MDRNREARRTTMAASNGLQRRRHRTSSLRDSPEEDGPVELQETARLRDRGSGKKDRDRDRDRERDRDRDRDRERDRDRLSRSKRRRGDRLTHGNRDDGGDESSEESVNDEEEDEDDDGGVGGGVGGGSVRMLPPPNPSAVASLSLSSSSSMLNHQRKSFPPVKNFRAASTWKAADEMIGVSVPRKARSASTKRSHEWSSSGIGIVGEQIHRQASTSPVRPSISSAAAPIPSQAPVSPSSSNASVRKKLKPNNGPKPRQPKPSSRSSSSAQDEIEIEIAEVLYGMMRQPQGPSKQEIMANDSIKLESRENTNKSTSDANKSSSDAKSRVSSPISCSQYGVPPQTSSRSSQPGGEPAWALCTAPKRKKPRLVKYDAKYEDAKPPLLTTQSNPISSAAKGPADQLAKTEASSAPLEKNAGSAAENGGIASDTAQSHAVPARATEAQTEPIKLEKSLVTESKPVAEKSESRDLGVSKEEPQSPKRESPGLRLDDKRETMTATAKPNSTTAEIEIQREEKFQIDLMAPPPSRSSPERDSEVDFVAVDAKPMALDTETEIKPVIKEDAKSLKIGREESSANVEPEKTKASTTTTTPVEVEAESKKPSVGKERNIDLQLDLEKTDTRDGGAVGVGGNKLHQHILPHRQQQQQQQHQQQQQQANNEKTPQSGAVPLPISLPGWPGGLPHMGYMAPLQGVVSMDGTAVSSAAIQPPPYLFNQPRPKRCATHCYIARSICYHQQIARMNSFWPAAPAAGSGSLYGAKPCNLNVLPSPDLNTNIPGRGINSVQDKGQGLAMFPGHNGKDKASQAANVVDSQRKQILIQQALPPGAPSNILQGPAIIFPLSQQQAVAASSVRPGSVKSPAAGNPTTSSMPNSTSATASATAAAAAPAMTFNYPNIPGNEATQYLAINAYSFPIPAHVGAPPAYRGTHPQAMPFFNGSFYSTFHPSQLQQQQPPSHSQQNQQGHQNPSMSSSSSSSQKHLQNQQHRPPHAGGQVNGGSGSLQGFPTPKNQSSQPLQLQQRQQQGQHHSHPARQLESEMGSEDSPSTADSRVSRSSMNIYGQNFAMPMHAPNFALMTQASIGTAGGANGAGGNNVEKKQQQQQQQQGSKTSGVEPSQAFAMSFASINGTAPGLDITSIATQQQAIFPDVRQGYQQYMAAAAVAAAQAVAQQKKNYRGPEDGKTGGDSSNLEEERKTMKGSSGVGQAIAFSRPDLSDASVSTIPGTTVVDSSARTLNLGSTQQRPSGSVMPAAISNVNASSAQQQLQRNHQQQHMIQLQKQQQQQQQQQLAAVARTKTPAASNGSVYSDHLSSSMAAKFPNALSTFPQNLVHSSSSPAQSPQWKSSVRSNTPQVPSPSMTSSTSSSLKNLSQQQGRTQQTHTQISFAANPKPSSQSQGLQPASSNQTPSPPIMVGSPTTSSVSKSAGGSPRTTTSTSTGNKVGQASSLSSQQAKNSPSIPNMKSSPVAGKNVPSILGNPHITSSSSAGTKAQLSQQQQQQQQLSKHSLQQAQLFFSPYIPAQAPHSNSPTASTAAASSAYYSQRRRPEQQQQSQSASVTSSSGMLSLCPVTLSNTSTSDAKAAAAAAATASNMKGLPSQALMHPAQFAAAAAAAAQSGNTHQLLPVGFPYVHAVPAAVQVKPAEQKQPAGE